MPSMTEPIICAFCGNKRYPKFLNILGEDRFVGYEPCTCDDFFKASEERKANEKLEEERKLSDQRKRKLERAGIPKRYRDCYHSRAEKLADSVSRIGSWIYIYGKNGTLKSTLAYCIAMELIKRGYDVQCVSTYDLMDAMRVPDSNDRDFYERARKCGILVLDDLGKEATASAYACERLFSLIDTRSKELLPTIITSNFKLSDLAANIQTGGVGVAIASRIKEDALIVEMAGEDRRAK